MTVSEIISIRRSVRSFKKIRIEQEKIDLILEAGRLAPSARNQQIWKFVLVRDKDMLVKLAHAADDQMFVAESDALIVGCALKTDYQTPNGEFLHTIDVSIALSFMMLQAADLGLGSCWITSFSEEKTKKLLRIPPEVRIVSLLALGYPHYVPAASDRKSLSEIVSVENFAQPYDRGV